jgi:hypothetical protein
MVNDSMNMNINKTENINKLKKNKANYIRWAFQMRLLLQENEVLSAIDDTDEKGNEMPLHENAARLHENAAREKNNKALLLITLTIHEDLIFNIRHKTAAESWKALHPKNSLAVAKALQIKIESARPADFNSLQDYLERQRSLWTMLQLYPSGKTIFSENMFVMAILERLPQDYNTIKQMIQFDFNQTNTFDWESVKISLEDAELNLQRHHDQHEPTPDAALHGYEQWKWDQPTYLSEQQWTDDNGRGQQDEHHYDDQARDQGSHHDYNRDYNVQARNQEDRHDPDYHVQVRNQGTTPDYNVQGHDYDDQDRNQEDCHGHDYNVQDNDYDDQDWRQRNRQRSNQIPFYEGQDPYLGPPSDYKNFWDHPHFNFDNYDNWCEVEEHQEEANTVYSFYANASDNSTQTNALTAGSGFEIIPQAQEQKQSDEWTWSSDPKNGVPHAPLALSQHPPTFVPPEENRPSPIYSPNTPSFVALSSPSYLQLSPIILPQAVDVPSTTTTTKTTTTTTTTILKRSRRSDDDDHLEEVQRNSELHSDSSSPATTTTLIFKSCPRTSGPRTTSGGRRPATARPPVHGGGVLD